MATKAHKLLTGTDLHEPKGVETQPAGKVYVSDGAGSGIWTTVNTEIGFSTGDIKPTIKTAPDTGWLMLNDTTIGSAGSPATNFGDIYQTLFLLLWNNVSNTYAAVTPSRGGSAASDWAANKTIALPKALGRVLGGAGSGVGLSTRPLGSTYGSESVVLVTANLPAYTPTGTIANGLITGVLQASSGLPIVSANTSVGVGGGGIAVPAGLGNLNPSVFMSQATSFFTGVAQGGTSQPFDKLQPTLFVNWMIKY